MTKRCQKNPAPGQPRFRYGYLTKCALFSYGGHVNPLLATAQVDIVGRTGLPAPSEMSQLRHCEDRRSRNWSAVVVLIAICSLTLSLATRYTSPSALSSHAVKIVRTQAPTDAKRQRLAKNAVNWIPPVVCFGVLPTPVLPLRFAPAAPLAAGLLFEVSRFNRPPPFSVSLS